MQTTTTAASLGRGSASQAGRGQVMEETVLGREAEAQQRMGISHTPPRPSELWEEEDWAGLVGQSALVARTGGLDAMPVPEDLPAIVRNRRNPIFTPLPFWCVSCSPASLDTSASLGLTAPPSTSSRRSSSNILSDHLRCFT